MTTHTVTVVEVKELTDELVSYRCRCCNEAATDSWCTLSVHIEDHDASLQTHKDKISARHEKKQAWRQKYLPKRG